MRYQLGLTLNHTEGTILGAGCHRSLLSHRESQAVRFHSRHVREIDIYMTSLSCLGSSSIVLVGVDFSREWKNKVLGNVPQTILSPLKSCLCSSSLSWTNAIGWTKLSVGLTFALWVRIQSGSGVSYRWVACLRR